LPSSQKYPVGHLISEMRVVFVIASPLFTTGSVPNNANAATPEPVGVIDKVLDGPVVADVMTRLLPTAVTVAPVMREESAVAPLSTVLQFATTLTVCGVPSTTTIKS
tara:strand:+ start:336 stop:656 length:321 start_codon:yes stop_codon:yes gene_type:complete